MLTAAAIILWLWAFWLLYVLVMGLYRAHLARRLGPVTKVLGLPFLAVGAVIDALSNLTLATLLFLEPPGEWLVTQRLMRHMRGEGWRSDLARWICGNLLDPFDPDGSHCD